MLRLRTSDGLDMAMLSDTFGEELAYRVLSSLMKHMRCGLVYKLPRIPDNRDCTTKQHWDFRLRLSDPEGFLLSNTIISDVFANFSIENVLKEAR
jgi:hypothetical protein